eukprot:986106-Prorocentrum_minimum.AAC.1
MGHRAGVRGGAHVVVHQGANEGAHSEVDGTHAEEGVGHRGGVRGGAHGGVTERHGRGGGGGAAARRRLHPGQRP